MIAPASTSPVQREEALQVDFRQFLRDNWVAMVVVILSTIIVEAGFFIIMSKTSPGSVLPAFLAVIVVWSTLTPGCFAAGGETMWGRFLRGVCVADATFVSLMIVYLIPGSGLDFYGVIKVYCISASLSLASCAIVGIIRCPSKRCIAVIVTSLIFIVCLTTPLWTNSVLKHMDNQGDGVARVAQWAVRVNPFFATCDAVVQQTEFHWTTADWMYTHTSLGENIPTGEVPWYHNCILLLIVTFSVWGIAGLWSRLGPGTSHAPQSNC